MLDESVEADYESAKEFVSKMSGNISDVMVRTTLLFYQSLVVEFVWILQASYIWWQQRSSTKSVVLQTESQMGCLEQLQRNVFPVLDRCSLCLFLFSTEKQKSNIFLLSTSCTPNGGHRRNLGAVCCSFASQLTVCIEGKKKEEDNWGKPVGGFTVGYCDESSPLCWI